MDLPIDLTIDELKRNVLITLLGISMNMVMPLINRIELYYESHVLETRLDKKIPVKVYFVIPYLAYFPYMVGSWAYFGLTNYEYFFEFVMSMGVLNVLTGVFNLIMPTKAPRAYIYGQNVLSRLIRWHYSLNNPRTAFPSLHVAHTITISYFLMMALPDYNFAWLAMPVLVALSTLFTKEHYILDVIGGALIGLFIPYLLMAI